MIDQLKVRSSKEPERENEIIKNSGGGMTL